MQTDESLMELVAAGEEAAFEELCKRFSKRLYYFAWRHVRDGEAAKDLAQETLLRLWRHRGAFRAGSRLSTWLFSINLNLCRDHLRRQGRTVSIERPEVALAAEMSAGRSRPPDALARAEREELAALLTEALEALPPLQAELLRMRRSGDLDFDEAGRRLGLSGDAARTAASRAYKKLREWMRQRTGD